MGLTASMLLARPSRAGQSGRLPGRKSRGDRDRPESSHADLGCAPVRTTLIEDKQPGTVFVQPHTIHYQPISFVAERVELWSKKAGVRSDIRTRAQQWADSCWTETGCLTQSPCPNVRPDPGCCGCWTPAVVTSDVGQQAYAAPPASFASRNTSLDSTNSGTCAASI